MRRHRRMDTSPVYVPAPTGTQKKKPMRKEQKTRQWSPQAGSTTERLEAFKLFYRRLKPERSALGAERVLVQTELCQF
ncbi:hypothetical protein EYF80_033919 [Liparis tanakae]|uniref:Uncharacterized protein n=1 Tax=Liparis tanakae TaxID=230148 RepID=A0A4Z2GRA6_9TELE|nr:hypothetical protein EYF80_033919 [Liparis tanakae]